MGKFFLFFVCFILTASFANANNMKCNFFFKAVGSKKVFTRALFVEEDGDYEVHFSLTDHNPYFPGEPALTWKTPFISDAFYSTRVIPKVKKIGTTIVLDWNINNIRIPTGHITNLQFHVSIKKKSVDESIRKFVVMDVMSNIEPGAGVSSSGNCKY